MYEAIFQYTICAMQKQLSQLIETFTYESISDSSINPIISSLAFDSRNVKLGSLFFALPGTHVHGNAFIAKAIEKGAVAIIYQDDLPNEALIAASQYENVNRCLGTANFGASMDQEMDLNAIFGPVVFIKVKDSRFTMSPVADAFYDTPSSKLCIIGITGTEGKSSTVSIIWQLLLLSGKKAGFISTVQYSLGDRAIDNPEHQTTPEAPIIQEKLFQMVQNDCEYAVIESSSHGLSLKTNRCGNIRYDAVAVMNVTHEHLEFHGSLTQYASDKANLFKSLDLYHHDKVIRGKKIAVPSFGVVNDEDHIARSFSQETSKPVFAITTFGKAGGKAKVPDKSGLPCLEAHNIVPVKNGNFFDLKGTDFLSETLNVFIPLPGAFNIYNVMTALIIVSKILQKPITDYSASIRRLIPIKGRMTEINKGQPFEVIIDYAHTPSSFSTIYPPIRDRAKGKIISVFGSGGNRDIKKRPEQGAIAAQYSDIVILTDEDPRDEDSIALLGMIAEGCRNPYSFGVCQGTELHCDASDSALYLIPDRPTAIRKAFSLAQKDDIVLLLGKAHENSIIYSDYTMPYDEIIEACAALAEIGYKEG